MQRKLEQLCSLSTMYLVNLQTDICVQVSEMRGSAWEWRDERQAYYFHQFTKQEPDLNYYSPDVKREIEVSII